MSKAMPPGRARWLPSLLRRKERGDVIAAEVGEGAQGVAVGKNILQNVTIVITAMPLLTLAVVAGMVIVVAVATHHSTPPAPPMSGDLNVAVAAFDVRDAHGRPLDSTAGGEMASSVSRSLNAEVASQALATAVQVRQVPSIAGATPLERVHNAARVARSINADIVVYGRVEVGANESSVTPEVYLSPRQVQETEELFGHYETAPIPIADDITTNPSMRGDAGVAVRERVHALVLFIIGMGYYEGGVRASTVADARSLFLKAQGYLKQAGQSWNDRDGKEVLYLFQGSTAGRLGDLASAQRYYAQALKLNPQYARAQVAMAEVRFEQSRGACPFGPLQNPAGLRATINLYQRARQARVQPAQSDIPMWVAFGLGKSYLCLSQGTGVNNWAEAMRELKKVIGGTGHDSIAAPMQDVVAQAHGDLGLVYLLAPTSGAASVAQYRRAAAELHAAIALTVRQNLQAPYYGLLAYVYRRLQQPRQAQAAYVRAASLDPAHRALYQAWLRQSPWGQQAHAPPSATGA